MTQNPFSDNPFSATETFSLGSIFDIRFTRFITNVLVPVIWRIVLIISFLDYGYTLMTAFGVMPPNETLEVLLFTPLRFVLSILSTHHPIAATFLSTILLCIDLVVARIGLEIVIVVFRIETHLRTIREKYENK